MGRGHSNSLLFDDGSDNFDRQQPCLLMIAEVGRRVVGQSYRGDRGIALTLVRLE